LYATAIPAYSKYPGLLVEKKPGFELSEIAKNTGIDFGKTRVGNTSFKYVGLDLDRKI